MKRKYIYKPYNPCFPELFQKEKLRLLGILNPKTVTIEHIGSTAVPGLGGKGIIDIGVVVAKDDIESTFRCIESLGYTFRETGSSPERLFFRVDLPDFEEDTRRYHLHLTFSGSLEWKRLIAFRDYLRSDPLALQAYADLKKKSAQEANEDGVLYREKKAPFFKSALEKLFK